MGRPWTSVGYICLKTSSGQSWSIFTHGSRKLKEKKVVRLSGCHVHSTFPNTISIPISSDLLRTLWPPSELGVFYSFASSQHPLGLHQGKGQPSNVLSCDMFMQKPSSQSHAWVCLRERIHIKNIITSASFLEHNSNYEAAAKGRSACQQLCPLLILLCPLAVACQHSQW